MVQALDFSRGETNKDFFPEIQSQAEGINIQPCLCMRLLPQLPSLSYLKRWRWLKQTLK